MFTRNYVIEIFLIYHWYPYILNQEPSLTSFHQSGVSIDITGTTILGCSSIIDFLLPECLLEIVPLDIEVELLSCIEYEIFPYSCKHGQTPRRNWQKSFRIPNHPGRNMSRVLRKPAFCICENKDADQLRGNREADQRLCFHYTDSTIPLLSKCEISSI